MPGVPDFYQGTEFWDLSLVDPDNRRPVDFAERAAALAVGRNTGLAKPRAALARRPYQAGLDPASAEAAHRTCRCVRAWRLPAAGGHRAAPRPCHRLCAAPRPRRRDRRGRKIIRRRCRRAAGPGRARRALTARSTSTAIRWKASTTGATELRLSDAVPASAGRGAEGQVQGRPRSRRESAIAPEPSLKTRKAARDRTAGRPGGCRADYEGRFPSPAQV